MLFFPPMPIKKKIKGPQGGLGIEWIPPQCWQKHQLGWRPGGPELTGRVLSVFFPSQCYLDSISSQIVDIWLHVLLIFKSKCE